VKRAIQSRATARRRGGGAVLVEAWHFFFSSRRRHTRSVSAFLLNRSSDLKPPLPALTVKLSKYNVDDVALGVCKTGAEEAGVTEVRTSLSEKKFELWREIKV